MKSMQRVSRQVRNGAHHPYFVTIAAAALASATCVTAMFGASDKAALAESVTDDNGNGRCNTALLTSPNSSASWIGGEHTSASNIQKPMLLAASPIDHLHYSEKTKHLQDKDNIPQQKIIECDYVIIGHGKAGQSAVRTIQKMDPTADIIVIDPNNNNNKLQNDMQHRSVKKRNLVGNKVDVGSINHLPTRASYIEHSSKLIHVQPITTHNSNIPSAASSINNDATLTNNANAVHYRKSALLATGSRGAPPPEGCISQDAWSRILELRSTTLPPSIQSGHHSSSKTSMMKPIPVLDPPSVRSLSVMAASQGATIAIMGSGFEALELAAYCARVSKASSSSSTKSNSQQNDDKKVLLLFGNSAPMSNRLPRYLSAAVSKRLRQFGIEVEDRAMTRYISMDKPMLSNVTYVGSLEPPRLEVYTVKSYDHLDSKRMLADLLVLAPSVDGLNGTAVVPTTSTNRTSFTSTKNMHLPWSSLISPPLLTCYLDDGRIATNSEFHAASSLYAAGSVAKYPNVRTGQAEVAGGRHVSAELAGMLAARNMVGAVDSPSPCYMQESIPVWRSDVIPYLPAAQNEISALALYSMGIHALCVGRCDSEGMATHGFWWTNTNQQSNNNDSKNGNSNSSDSKNSSNSNGNSKPVGPNAFMRRATRKANATTFKGSSSRGSLPVYGSGIVYYLDRSGNIEGIMLWGLPYSMDPKNVESHLNNELVERMKDMIRSNGGIALQDHSKKILSEHSGLNIDYVQLLSYLHLAEESKYLASMALSGSTMSTESTTVVNQKKKVSVSGRPLHRYTPIKPVVLTNLGKLSRKDENGNLTEEDDLFYSSMATGSASTFTTSTSLRRVEESGRPPSLKRIYPMQGGGTAAFLVGTEEYTLRKEMERHQLQIERSRPPKEEPLWLRHGEEHRFVNRRDAIAEAFMWNIQAGRFSDGEDAVRQAPVPKFYLDAKEKVMNSLSSGGVVGDDGDETEEAEE